MSILKKPSAWDIVYSIAMALACIISYAMMMELLNVAVEGRADLVGGMWAAVSTAFVFRDSRQHSFSAAAGRLIATCVSFALCLYDGGHHDCHHGRRCGTPHLCVGATAAPSFRYGGWSRNRPGSKVDRLICILQSEGRACAVMTCATPTRLSRAGARSPSAAERRRGAGIRG